MEQTANKDISLSLIKHDGVPQHQLSFALTVVLPGKPKMHLDITLQLTLRRINKYNTSMEILHVLFKKIEYYFLFVSLLQKQSMGQFW